MQAPCGRGASISQATPENLLLSWHLAVEHENTPEPAYCSASCPVSCTDLRTACLEQSLVFHGAATRCSLHAGSHQIEWGPCPWACGNKGSNPDSWIPTAVCLSRQGFCTNNNNTIETQEFSTLFLEGCREERPPAVRCSACWCRGQDPGRGRVLPCRERLRFGVNESNVKFYSFCCTYVRVYMHTHILYTHVHVCLNVFIVVYFKSVYCRHICMFTPILHSFTLVSDCAYVSVSACVAVCLCICLSVCLPVYLPNCLSVHLFYPFICLSIYLFVYLLYLLYPSVYPWNLSICPSIHPSLCLSACVDGRKDGWMHGWTDGCPDGGVYVCMYGCTYECACIYVGVCMYTRTFIICTCICICTHSYICVYIYTHTYTH